MLGALATQKGKATVMQRISVRMGRSGFGRMFGVIAFGAISGLIPRSALAAVFNVMDFGATGSPTGIDTAAIQAAIDAAYSAGGAQTVFFPPGTYVVTNRIVLRSRVSLQGSGRGSTVRAHDTFCDAVKFQQTPQLCPNSMIGFNSYSDPVVNDLSIRFLQIDGNKASNVAGSGIFVAGSNITIDGCYIRDTPHAGIVIGTSGSQTCRNVQVLNNWVHNPSAPGLFWGALAVTGCKPPTGSAGVVFNGNLATTDDGGMSYGITIEPNSGWAQNVQNVVIQSNTIRGGFIAATGDPAAFVKDIQILRNDVDASPANGIPEAIRVYGVTGSVTISDNSVRGPGHSNAGIRLKDLVNPTVRGNFITGMGVAQTTYPDNVGMLLDHVLGGTVWNNTIAATGQTSAGAVAGIKTINGTGSISYLGNVFHKITVTGPSP
jgi:hypothetical protein